ncbi:hypothetical protein FGO68_gene7471 [Halteria grandinella]|uniref:Uncharacterized protein n=1 Tax=Halteria grandinella TaxID=5974 RepID=A0A8J8P9R5_HALGN|nr:hypothetical protein FGO68_gene7471 [Halteria grandinella]
MEDNSEIHITSEEEHHSHHYSDHDDSYANQIGGSNQFKINQLKSECIDSSIREEDSDTQDLWLLTSQNKSHSFTKQATKKSKSPTFKTPMIKNNQTQIWGQNKKKVVISPIMTPSLSGKQRSFKITTKRITELDFGDQVSVQVVKQVKAPKSKETIERGRIRINKISRHQYNNTTTNVSGSKQIQLEDVTIIDEEAPY